MRVESEHARSFYEIESVRSRWASRELGRQINEIVTAVQESGRIEELKKGLRDVYGKDMFDDQVSKFSDSDLIALGKSVAGGVPSSR